MPMFRTPWRIGVAAIGVTLVAGCATTRIAPGTIIADTSISDKQTVIEHASTTFAASLSQSSGDVTNAALALDALHKGRAMLDLHCERYLDALGTANQSASHQRKQGDLIGGFAAAVMGLTGSPAKHVSAVATSFAFAGTSFDAFTTSYLFSDAAKSVTRIVRASQRAFLDGLRVDLGRLDYPTVIEVLTGYEAVCRPAQIRQLVDDAISRAEIVPEVRSVDAASPEMVGVSNDLTAAFGQRFTELEVINLYAWWNRPAQRATLAKNEPIATLKKTRSDDALDTALGRVFLPLSLADSRLVARWKPVLDRIAAPNGNGARSPGAAPASGTTDPTGKKASDTNVFSTRIPTLRVR